MAFDTLRRTGRLRMQAGGKQTEEAEKLGNTNQARIRESHKHPRARNARLCRQKMSLAVTHVTAEIWDALSLSLRDPTSTV